MVDIGIRGSPWNESNTRQILEVSHDPENSAEQLNILYKASLERTCHHIAANYADYTAWYFRRKALVHLGLVDKQELSEKNVSIWISNRLRDHDSALRYEKLPGLVSSRMANAFDFSGSSKGVFTIRLPKQAKFCLNAFQSC